MLITKTSPFFGFTLLCTLSAAVQAMLMVFGKGPWPNYGWLWAGATLLLPVALPLVLLPIVAVTVIVTRVAHSTLEFAIKILRVRSL